MAYLRKIHMVASHTLWGDAGGTYLALSLALAYPTKWVSFLRCRPESMSNECFTTASVCIRSVPTWDSTSHSNSTLSNHTTAVRGSFCRHRSVGSEGTRGANVPVAFGEAHWLVHSSFLLRQGRLVLKPPCQGFVCLGTSKFSQKRKKTFKRIIMLCHCPIPHRRDRIHLEVLLQAGTGPGAINTNTQ